MIRLRNRFFSERRLYFLEYSLFKRYLQSIRLWAPDGYLRDPENRPILFFCGPHSWWDRILEVPVIERYRLDPIFSLKSRRMLNTILLDPKRDYGKGLGACQPTIFINCSNFSNSNRNVEHDFGLSSEMAVFLENSQYTALPMAKKIVFGKWTRPEVFIEIGPPVAVCQEEGKSGKIDPAALESAYRRVHRKLLNRIAKRDFSDAILHLAPRRIAGSILSS